MTTAQRQAVAKWPPRLCVVCGARVTNTNPKVSTCDAVCGRARRAGRTRAQQHAADMAEDGPRLRVASRHGVVDRAGRVG